MSEGIRERIKEAIETFKDNREAAKVRAELKKAGKSAEASYGKQTEAAQKLLSSTKKK